MNFVVKEIIKSSVAISSGKGELLRNALVDNFHKAEILHVDFQGITDLTTAFLNVGIGHLYDKFSIDDVDQKLAFMNLDELDHYLIKQVRDRIDLNYKKDQDLKELLEEVLENGKDS